MSEKEHERWKDEVAAYLLGTLSPGEAAELERHVAGCQECQREMRLAAPRGRPAARSRRAGRALRRTCAQTLMAEVRAEPSAPRPSASAAPLSPAQRLAPGRRAGDGRPAARRRRRLRDPRRRIQRRTGGDDGRVAGKAPGVTAKMVSTGDSGTLQLANVHDLPRTGARGLGAEGRHGRTGKRLFVPDSDGNASTTIPDTEGVEPVMVTAEPRGGSDSPTSAAMVTLEIPE